MEAHTSSETPATQCPVHYCDLAKQKVAGPSSPDNCFDKMFLLGSQWSRGRVSGYKESSQGEGFGASAPVEMFAEASVGWSPLAKKANICFAETNTAIWKQSLMKPSSDTKFASTWVARAVASCPQQHDPSEACCSSHHLFATDRCSDFAIQSCGDKHMETFPIWWRTVLYTEFFFQKKNLQSKKWLQKI